MLIPLKRLLLPSKARAFTSLSPLPVPISPSDFESLVLRQFRAGKFHTLLPSVVADPSVLLAACHNLFSRSHPSSSTPSLSLLPFSLSGLSTVLRSGAFDPALLCSSLASSSRKGQALTLPTLELKVALEALRMTLAAVYESRLATFAYGGRAAIGRHTAIRYIKSTVRNPTWWFRVTLQREPFGTRHVRRLAAVMEEKIDDPALIALVERLFESVAVAIELGGVGLRRGFPQESDLSSILINIYFDAVDREIQELRADVHKKNPRLRDLEGENYRVIHTPIRVYAVRYLDEILVITSGSKLFTMNIKDRILKHLEGELEVKIDKLKTSIHSAVSEKMDFMGMELQAVPPSVLDPPMSEKAIRAMKKYLKRKAAKALELKNARETRRKKLGLKILNHLFKKLKRGHVFEFDFRIESEVREVFRNWAEEVMAEYFRSREDRRNWHRMLTTGDFLSLKRVRDQLPTELVDSYDQFQAKVDKYLNPVRISKVIEKKERQEEEKEERSYARRTVEDLTELKMRVNAPIQLVRRAVKLAGFTNSMGRPRPIKLLICLDDADIIKWYAGVGRRWLEYFCCCWNFKMVKTVVNYHLRFSCFLTLAEKHESTKHQAIRHYTKDLKVTDDGGVEEVHFPTEREIRMMGDKNLSDPKPVDGALSMILARLAVNEPACSCLAHFCDRKDTVLYRIRLLQNRLHVDPWNENKWVPGMGAIHESLNKKVLSLCPEHASDLFMGRITLQDIDCTSFVNV
ncbi:nuclear intron maturase 3, mitochondrial [Elaeis guineensis]|uniref:nuclear intron maturase 3, mitochondrial n=1 Tax=Elaeis guineensis var. tenera TaxID=51953 RepID=UPI003C6D1869